MQMAGVPPMGAPGFGLVCQPALERQRQLLQLLAGAPANNNLLLQQPAVPQGVPHTFLPPQRVQLPLQRNAQAAPAEQPASTQDSVVLVEEQQETSKDVRISDQGASTSAGNHQQSPCSGSSSKGAQAALQRQQPLRWVLCQSPVKRLRDSSLGPRWLCYSHGHALVCPAQVVRGAVLLPLRPRMRRKAASRAQQARANGVLRPTASAPTSPCQSM